MISAFGVEHGASIAKSDAMGTPGANLAAKHAAGEHKGSASRYCPSCNKGAWGSRAVKVAEKV